MFTKTFILKFPQTYISIFVLQFPETNKQNKFAPIYNLILILILFHLFIFIGVIICCCWCSPILSNNGFCICWGPRTALNSWYDGGGAIASCLIIFCCSVSISFLGMTRGLFWGEVAKGINDECRLLLTRINARKEILFYF